MGFTYNNTTYTVNKHFKQLGSMFQKKRNHCCITHTVHVPTEKQKCFIQKQNRGLQYKSYL